MFPQGRVASWVAIQKNLPSKSQIKPNCRTRLFRRREWHPMGENQPVPAPKLQICLSIGDALLRVLINNFFAVINGERLGGREKTPNEGSERISLRDAMSLRP